jgi:DNA invertase Pin-like site-specific DNA recombinase
MAKQIRVGIYLRVSTDGQTIENQRQALDTVAVRRGWTIVQTYADEGISGAKGRDARPAFDMAMKDASRRRFDVLAVWSVDRLGRSAATVTAAIEELSAVGVTLFADKEGVDGTTPHGKAMLQMASVFGELERGMIRQRVQAGLERARKAGKHLGRRRVGAEVEAAVRASLAAGNGILKTAKLVGVGSGTAQRIAKEAAAA